MANYAVIDLGTNTFHLLIVDELSNGQFKEVYRQRIFVKLAEEGIDKIGEQPFQRGLNALGEFKKVLDQYAIEKLKVMGTAALRTASNGLDFVKQVQTLHSISIELIDGKEEARLIHQGVGLVVDLNQEKSMIMDIGGGSVEFIIGKKDEVEWARSFPIGVAVLFKKFHKNDPITFEEIQEINNYLSVQLKDLLDYLAMAPVHHLVGASGTFDVLEMQINHNVINPSCSELHLDEFPSIYQNIVQSNLEERLAMPLLPPSRADMIIVALVLIRFVLERAKIQKLSVTSYAMKEGMLRELFDKPTQ